MVLSISRTGVSGLSNSHICRNVVVRFLVVLASLRSAVISLCECRIAWNVTFAKQLLPKFVMPLSGMSRVYSSSVPAPPGSLMCCVSVASFGML